MENKIETTTFAHNIVRVFELQAKTRTIFFNCAGYNPRKTFLNGKEVNMAIRVNRLVRIVRTVRVRTQIRTRIVVR